MSGSVGGSRIPRSAVQGTLDNYRQSVLFKFQGFKTAKISGSYNTGLKKDHGDIDLVVYVDGGDRDLKTVKKEFKQYLESLPDTVTLPFPSGRNQGKKAQLYGNIVTCLVPMDGFSGLGVQVDNIIVLSEQDQKYQKSFLDLPAEKQALIQGLARVLVAQESVEKIASRLGISGKLKPLEKNQEYEFALGPSELTLRKVTYGKDFKEENREVVWASRDWDTVLKLLKGFDLTQDFDHLLGQVAEKIKDSRSRSRILGIMKSMINVGEKEKGTPKGDGKERAIQKASSQLGALEEVDENDIKDCVALYGGGFKPPHKAHFENALKLCKGVDRLIIFIGSKVRDGVPVTAEQSKEIWNIYRKYLPKPVELRISNPSPISDIYKIIAEPDFSETKFVIGQSAEEDDKKKFAWLIKNQQKFPNVHLKELPLIPGSSDEKFSASTLRKSVDILKKGTWMPKCLSREDASEVLDILIKPLEREILQEELRENMKRIIGEAVSIVENSTGTEVAPTETISSKDKEILSQLYDQIVSKLGDHFSVSFNGTNIIVKVKGPGDVDGYCNPGNFDQNNLSEDEETQSGSIIYGGGETKDFDWASNIASMVGFYRKNGLKLDPLPEIILKKQPQSDGLLDRTGCYDPERNVIELYTAGRHVKDVARTLSHELIHSEQAREGRIGKVSTDKLSEDKHLEELEAEAYKKGNLLFRKWTETLRK